LGGSARNIKKSTEDFVVTNKETGKGECAEKIKYMIISRYQNAGQSYNIKTDYSSFKKVEQFKYLKKNLVNQSSIQEEIKSRLNSENGCYHSLVQNLLPSSSVR
jgi:hypothetical protein